MLRLVTIYKNARSIATELSKLFEAIHTPLARTSTRQNHVCSDFTGDNPLKAAILILADHGRDQVSREMQHHLNFTPFISFTGKTIHATILYAAVA